MGMSTDAILFYGYVWEEEQYDEEPIIPEEALDLYGSDEPVLAGFHCSSDYGMPYVYVQASHTRASRGYPKTVKSLREREDWDAQLTAFVERFDISLTEAQGPDWYLVSYLG
jgi:hypothetical protein